MTALSPIYRVIERIRIQRGPVWAYLRTSEVQKSFYVISRLGANYLVMIIKIRQGDGQKSLKIQDLFI